MLIEGIIALVLITYMLSKGHFICLFDWIMSKIALVFNSVLILGVVFGY